MTTTRAALRLAPAVEWAPLAAAGRFHGRQPVGRLVPRSCSPCCGGRRSRGELGSLGSIRGYFYELQGGLGHVRFLLVNRAVFDLGVGKKKIKHTVNNRCFWWV